MKKEFSIRKPIFISIDDLDTLVNLDDTQLSNLILIHKNNNRESTFDVGSWCFGEVQKRNHINKVRPVNLKSYKKDRVHGIKNMLIKFIEESQSFFTLKNKIKILEAIFNYINEYYSLSVLNNFNDAVEVYRGYTNYLLNQIRELSASGKLSDLDKYSQKQKNLRLFLELCSGVSSNKFSSIIRKIKSDKANRPISISNKHDINLFVRCQLEIFENIANFILDERKIPFILDLREYNSRKFIMEFNIQKKESIITDDLFYDKDDNIVTFDNFFKKIESRESYIKSSYSKKTIKELYNYKVNKINEFNSREFKKCSIKVKLSNIAILAFCKAFIATTGANEAVLYELKFGKFEYLSSRKGMRVYGSKIRAGGKKVTLEFGVVFKKYFELYLRLREYLLINFNPDSVSEVVDKLFFNIPLNSNPVRQRFSKLDNVFFCKYNYFLKNVFRIKVISNRDLRKNVGNCYLNIINDSSLVAEKLNNTPRTVVENYSDVSFDEMAAQLSKYYEAIRASTILRYRLNNELISVKLKERNIENSDFSTPIGNCEEPIPILKSEFNRKSLQPSCKKLETCLFCQKYILHINSIDIKKILSLRMILNNLRIKTDEVEQIIYRINEILEFMKVNFPYSEKIIDRTVDEVEEGYLDDFWLEHLKLLITLEEI
ncbi:hypothetical protein [Acinetobacter baumannii]|uniref:hypothetical protein n=1 Tax=Acinetobacter baumannii TaxID=470 RepID=UPI001C0C3A11|nr:hypothetical protein [Acinetobacter baumannii]MBU3081600.1 hypothetical protein [Acinetobacter baumannii]